MTEPPNPYGPPDDRPDDQPGGWGGNAPNPWGAPPPPTAGDPWTTPAEFQTRPGSFAPPPGWVPPPQKKMTAGQIFGGIAAWFGVNFILLGLLRELLQVGEAGGLLLLAVNAAMIAVPAIKGHKGFAVGYALGFVVAAMLFLAACFVLIASFSGGS